ncbi:hypothetical protein BDC45DRAFT_562430 [Circinella umbellata]|nr:hypothetical protein BDC45DRAFT_562430 [Circinella umbellata]
MNNKIRVEDQYCLVNKHIFNRIRNECSFSPFGFSLTNGDIQGLSNYPRTEINIEKRSLTAKTTRLCEKTKDVIWTFYCIAKLSYRKDEPLRNQSRFYHRLRLDQDILDAEFSVKSYLNDHMSKQTRTDFIILYVSMNK